MTNTLRRWRLLPVLTASVTLAFSACGGTKKTETTTGTTGTTATSATTASDGAAKFCTAVTKIETVGEPNIDFQSLSPDQQKAEAKKFAAETLKPLTPDVVATAPAEIKSSIETLAATVDVVATTGDFSAFEKPDVDAADKAVHAYESKNCGWGTQDVKGTEYAFQGVKPTIKAGTVSFELANNGKELHELNIIKKKDGVTESFDDLIKLPGDEGKAKTERVGGISPTQPGDSGHAVVNLEKGEYLIACFLPVGATPELFAKVESGEAKPPEGPPHAARGMTATITVT